MLKIPSMKTTNLIVLAFGLSSLVTMRSMGEIGVQINVPIPVVTIPAPGVTVQGVPDSYVWDGTEYVGVVGSQYYYLGPDKVWLTMDGPRRARFSDWEHSHADWRNQAIRNERYRSDAHGHTVPLRDNANHNSQDSRATDHSDSRPTDHQDSRAIDHSRDGHDSHDNHDSDHH